MIWLSHRTVRLQTSAAVAFLSLLSLLSPLLANPSGLFPFLFLSPPFAAAFTGIVPDALLPTATPLIFDRTKPALPRLTVRSADEIHWMQYEDVELLHFRRIPIALQLSLPELIKLRDEIHHRGMDSSPITMEVELVIKNPDPNFEDTPILLLEKKGFGGSNEITHDSSNFCDWLHADRAAGRSSVSIQVDPTRAGSRYKGLLSDGRRKLGIKEDYMLFVGFAGRRAHPRLLDFAVAARVKSDLPMDETVRPVCSVFERFSVAPHDPHMQRRVSVPGLEVITGEMVIRKWQLVPIYDEAMHPIDLKSAQRRAASSFNSYLRSHQLLAFGIEVPAAPLTDPLWRPHLIVQGPGVGEVDILVGAYHSRSIWELHRFEQLANGSTALTDTRIWALPLGGLITHLQTHRNSWLSPPGTSLLLLMMPRQGQSVDYNVEITLANLLGRAIALLGEPELSQGNSLTRTINGYIITVRTLLFGALGFMAAIGIVVGFWLAITEITIMNESMHKLFPRWIRKGVHQFVAMEGGDPDFVHVPARALPGIDGELEISDTETQGFLASDRDRRLVPRICALPVARPGPYQEPPSNPSHPLCFEISSAPTDSGRSTEAGSLRLPLDIPAPVSVAGWRSYSKAGVAGQILPPKTGQNVAVSASQIQAMSHIEQTAETARESLTPPEFWA